MSEVKKDETSCLVQVDPDLWIAAGGIGPAPSLYAKPSELTPTSDLMRRQVLDRRYYLRTSLISGAMGSLAMSVAQSREEHSADAHRRAYDRLAGHAIGLADAVLTRLDAEARGGK